MDVIIESRELLNNLHSNYDNSSGVLGREVFGSVVVIIITHTCDIGFCYVYAMSVLIL